MSSTASADVKNKGKDIPDDDPELQKIWDELDKVTGDDLRKRYAEFAKKYPQQLGGGKFLDEIDQQPEAEKPLEVPKEGRVKEWGANTDPSKWKVISMKRPKDKFKVVDENDKNVADQFTSKENAEYFIKYYIETHAVPTDNPGTKPDVPAEPEKPEKPEEKPEEPEPEKPEKPTEKYAFPVPAGFEAIGEFSTAFKHWGRHETNYASGGAGPSERWDNTELPDTLNVLAGYEFKIGPEHGERGSDNVDLKMRSNSHNNKSGGWRISFIEWEEDGSSGGAGVGSEYPHPTTSHLKFNVQGEDAKVDNIKDGQWHGFLTCCYNDKQGVPTINLWYNATATGKAEDYTLLGISKDTGNMKPGPVADKIDIKGGKPQSLQIRMDEVPNATIRNAFAVECKGPD